MRRVILTLIALLGAASPASAVLVNCTFPEKTLPAPRELSFATESDGRFAEVGRASPGRESRLWRVVAVRPDGFAVASTYGNYVLLVSRKTVEAEGAQVSPAILEWGETTVFGGRCFYTGPANWGFLSELQ